MALPSTYQQLVVTKLSTNFREAVSIVTADLKKPEPNEVIIRNKYVGVNASDVNVSAGRYFCSGKPPYGTGFEGVGEVAAVGNAVQKISPGQAVGYMCQNLNAYAEYTYVNEISVYPIPEIKPEYIVPLLSGLTSSIGLDKCGRIAEGETVLITAAAGGAGHVAVQWAKVAGCHVIGTCSSQEKVNMLKGIGCDRVINYKEENLDSVLKKEYPKGINTIWETIGGQVFETLFKHVAINGKIVIVGRIESYKTGSASTVMTLSTACSELVMKSTAIQGFLLSHFATCFKPYFYRLTTLFNEGKLKCIVDTGAVYGGKEFVGLESVIDAVEHLFSGKNMGKVVVKVF